MPQNYSRQESENQPEWGYGERAPYSYEASPQPGTREEWGWPRDAYPKQHERHPQHQQQYPPGGGGAPAPPWGSPSYGGAQQQQPPPGYQPQRRHSGPAQAHGQPGFPPPPPYSHQHEQHDQHQHAQRHSGPQPPHSYQHQMSGGWPPSHDQKAGPYWGVEIARIETQRDAGAGDAGSGRDQGPHRQDSHGGSVCEDGANWDAYNDCWSGCYRKLAPHLEVYSMLNKSDAEAGPGRASYKMQNNFLMKILFDEHGESPYHVDCVLRIFKISKGRLKRLQERIKRELRGELTRHGLYGRPSNNRKKPETIRQFTEFVKANRITTTIDDSAKVRYILPPQITSIQGDCPGSLKTQFDKHQIEMSTENNPRELVSSGTAQTWFKKYFEDTLLPSGPHPQGAATGSGSTAGEDDQGSSVSNDHAATGTPSASTSVSEKRPSSPIQQVSRKRLHVEKPDQEADENDSTDGTASTGNVSSDMQSRSGSHNGSRATASSASDSGVGSVADANSMSAPHKHKPHHFPHHPHVPKKKPGSDSDGSVIVESPELD